MPAGRPEQAAFICAVFGPVVALGIAVVSLMLMNFVLVALKTFRAYTVADVHAGFQIQTGQVCVS